jgi:hypothetical protein
LFKIFPSGVGTYRVKRLCFGGVLGYKKIEKKKKKKEKKRKKKKSDFY